MSLVCWDSQDVWEGVGGRLSKEIGRDHKEEDERVGFRISITDSSLGYNTFARHDGIKTSYPILIL